MSAARRWLGAIGMLVLALAGLGARGLTIGFSQGNFQPYAFIQDQTLTGGIIKEIGDALGAELKLAVEYQLWPTGRLLEQVRKGAVDLSLIENPAWTGDASGYNWSHELFSERNVFVSSAKNPLQVAAFEELRGKRVGTINGYFYPTMEALFARGQAIRDDVLDISQNFLKLDSGRIDVLLDSEILVKFRIKNLRDKYLIAPLIASEQNIYCMISKKASVPAERLITAFDTLKRQGVIDRILRKYQ